MMLWFWLCYEVQDRRAGNLFEALLCKWGRDDKVPRPWSSTVRSPAVPSPSPSVFGGKHSWPWELGPWHSCLPWKQRLEGKAVEPDEHIQAIQGHRDFCHSTSDKAAQQGWAVIPAASAAHGFGISSQGHQSVGKSPLPTWRWLLPLEMSQDVQDLVA